MQLLSSLNATFRIAEQVCPELLPASNLKKMRFIHKFLFNLL